MSHSWDIHVKSMNNTNNINCVYIVIDKNVILILKFKNAGIFVIILSIWNRNDKINKCVFFLFFKVEPTTVPF